MLFAMSDARAANVADHADTAAQQESLVRARALASATSDERARLLTIAGPDASAIVRAIQSVGTDANVPIQIGQASIAPVSDPLHAVSFIIEADGSFSSITRAIELFGSLPIPSQIEQFQLEQTPASDPAHPSKQWHLVMTIQFFTSATISS